MSTPAAFWFFQDFAPEPTKSFQVDRHYLFFAAKGTMRLEAGGRRWSLPPARTALIEAGSPITISLPQKMTVCSVLFATSFVVNPPTQILVFEMTPLAHKMVLACRNWGPEIGPLSDYSRSIF